MAPDGAVRSGALEVLRGDRMNQQQAWPDFNDWRNVRTGQEQVQMSEGGFFATGSGACVRESVHS
jgi:hypothetical protein